MKSARGKWKTLGTWHELTRHSITEFCQTQVVYANGKDAQAWLKETNLWLARKGKLKRELDGLVDKNDELPLPDRVKKNGKYVDIEYY